MNSFDKQPTRNTVPPLQYVASYSPTPPVHPPSGRSRVGFLARRSGTGGGACSSPSLRMNVSLGWQEGRESVQMLLESVMGSSWRGRVVVQTLTSVSSPNPQTSRSDAVGMLPNGQSAQDSTISKRNVQFSPFAHQPMFGMNPQNRTIQRSSVLLDNSRNNEDVVLLCDGFDTCDGGSGDSYCGFVVREEVIAARRVTFADGAAEREAFRISSDTAQQKCMSERGGARGEILTKLQGRRRVEIRLVPSRSGRSYPSSRAWRRGHI